MNMRRQLFVSNAAIVLVSLIMLMAVMAVMMKIAEETYMSRFDDLRQVTITDRNGDVMVFDNGDGQDRKTELYNRYRSEITALFVFFATVGISAAAFIFFLSSLFTRLMLNRITQPIETLSAAAKRISAENLDEPINYRNNDEFKEVCDAFDEMQIHLKEGIEKNIAYETARTTMITDISHDIRTPLTAVKGFLKGIMDGVADTPEKQLAYVNIAYNKACSMDILLDKLFYFSQLETDNLPIYTARTDLAAYLGEYADAIQPELLGRGSDISFSRGNDEYFSDIDKAQMSRVLDNLTENALKYNDGVNIKIMLYSDGESNVITVADNGSGVNSDTLPRLFERFYRADPSRNSAKEGSGLGLYIVERIVKLHGGTVFAENDSGLKITITLPKSLERGAANDRQNFDN